MHGHALAAGDVAYDLLAANRVTTFGAIDQQIIVALDLDGRTIATEDATDHAGETAAIAIILWLRLMA